ncbi:hypothetical protein HU200_044131 [Digitaria exilis]|uniref:Uncharacterized protein n=1 Tax=Digitaria exilis TaxID=1010633 RepID=A0A835B3D6_9POAL|nr:hypothetical protein HU200_044131 [Digitaria exilis]
MIIVYAECLLLYGQTTSRRLADRKTAKFQKNITRRGSVPETTIKKGNDYPVGPVVLGFFIFVVIGSCMPSNLFKIFLPILLFYAGGMLLCNARLLPALFSLKKYRYTLSNNLASNLHDHDYKLFSVHLYHLQAFC